MVDEAMDDEPESGGDGAEQPLGSTDSPASASVEPDATSASAEPSSASEEAKAPDASNEDGKGRPISAWDASRFGIDLTEIQRILRGFNPALDAFRSIPDPLETVRRQIADVAAAASGGEHLASLRRQMASTDAMTRLRSDITRFGAAHRIPGFEIPRFDFGDLIGTQRLVESALGSLRGFDFEAWERQIQAWRPPNWPENVDYGVLEKIVNDDGLPVVWVPRTEVLEQLLAASDRAGRVAILLSHEQSLVADCVPFLAEVTHDDLAGHAPLAVAALNAWQAGQKQAAQALAVVVLDSALRAVFEDAKNYKKFGESVRIDFEEAPASHIKALCSLAPVAAFYTPWWADSGDPVPEVLSRHVSIHFAADEHYTDEHALVSLLLMTSVLRGLQEALADYDQRNP